MAAFAHGRAALPRLRRVFVGLVVGLALVGLWSAYGCAPVEAIEGTQIAFQLDDSAGIFDAPFPILHRSRSDGSLDVSGFPNPSNNAIARRLLEGLERGNVGFGSTSAIFFRFDGPIDPKSLPTNDKTADADSPAFLIDIDPTSPQRGQRIPLWLKWTEKARTFGPAHTLTLLPRPGVVLRHQNLYAAVLLDGIRDAAGAALGSPLALERLKAGQAPEGPHGEALVEGYKPLWGVLDDAGIERKRVRAATVYRTGDPTGELLRLRRWLLQQPAPQATGLKQLQVFDHFCLIEGKTRLPLFQSGERPYSTKGGEIRADADGKPAHKSSEEVRFALTIPRRKMPAKGWPLLLYSAGQGGMYTQFVHRGTDAQDKAKSGMGPAHYLADVGIAAISIEAPMVGPRHPTGSFSGLEFFSVTNPLAFRDNARQAALDFTSLIQMAKKLAVPSTLCAEADAGGAASFSIDPKQLFFYGHSTGATVGGMLLGMESTIKAGMLSGVGGSWLYNLTLKEQPLKFVEVVKTLLNYNADDLPDIYDPLLNMAQTLWAPSEPMNWAKLWAQAPPAGAAPKHVLVIEGVIDGFFPPPAVNALAIAAKLTPVGKLVEQTLPDALKPFGIEPLDAPAHSNLKTDAGDVSALLIQYTPPDGVDGHYVPFVLPSPQYQYRCFFASLLQHGKATIFPPASDALASCPAP